MEANLVNFVRKRLALNELSFERYIEQVEIPGGDELRLLVEAMTVIYTWFFRDPGQFLIIEQLIRNFSLDRTMGIWVAGCATGEEPYSVALVATDLGKQVDILATDLNSEALRHAKTGRYALASLNPVDATMRARYLGGQSGDFEVPEAVKQRVRFQVGNLVEAAPKPQTTQGWDLVICRNVLIYFGRVQARRTLDTLAGSLAPGGTLVLGASEAILERPTGLNAVGISGRAVLVRPRPEDSQPSIPRAQNVGAASPQPQPNIFSSSAFSPQPRATPNVPITSLPQRNPMVQPDAANPTPENPSTLLIVPGVTDTKSARAAIEHGHCALNAGNIPVARSSYQRAVSLDPTSAEALMFAGITYYIDGDLAEALQRLRGALCLDASLWAAWFYQALCYENMGCAEDAARGYSQVVSLGQQTQRSDEHPFLKGWRNDLLAVASKRANQGKTGRVAGGTRLRGQSGSQD